MKTALNWFLYSHPHDHDNGMQEVLNVIVFMSKLSDTLLIICEIQFCPFNI